MPEASPRIADNASSNTSDIDVSLPTNVDVTWLLPPCDPMAERVVLLDPQDITIPPTANRLPESFADKQFENLRAGIKAANINVEPIMVRRVAGAARGYVLIYGERRLRACRAERLPVLAMLATSGNDAGDYLVRMRANIGTATLSPWEFGMQVRHIMQAQPKMTRVKLAEALGTSVSTISRAFDLGNLPDVIVGAFASAREIRVKDMKVLRDAWEAAPESVEAEVALIREEAEQVKGPDVVRRVAKAAKAAAEATEEFARCKVPPTTSAARPLASGDTQIGEWSMNAQGTLQLRLDLAMSDAQREALLALVCNFAERKVLARSKAKRVTAEGAAGIATTVGQQTLLGSGAANAEADSRRVPPLDVA